MTRVVRPNGVIELRANSGMALYSNGCVSDYVLVGLHGNENAWEELTLEEAEAKREEYELENEEIDATEALDLLMGGAE